MTTQTYTATVSVIHCPRCGLPFGLSLDYERAKRKDHGNFYCPNGHGQHFPAESDEEILRRQLATTNNALAAERSRKDQLAAELRDTRETSKREKAALKGSITKIKKRAAAAVCPVPGCKRSFSNVRRHIAHCHPDYAAEVEA